MAYRFFLNTNEINWNEKRAVISSQDDVYKISRVLRLRPNDPVVLLDGKGLIYNAQINSFLNRKIDMRLLSRRTVNTESNLKITICQSLLKGPKLDSALQKCTELGVYDFIPISTSRTVIKLQDDDTDRDMLHKINRLQRIVHSAAEQSERGYIPNVKNIMTLEELLKSNLSDYDLKLVCLERSETNKIKEVLNGITDKVGKAIIIIGPEGGFTEEEAKLMTSNGFLSVSLGKRIFRAETVGTVISTILFYHFNELN